MSELINKEDHTKGLRWQLLATTSAIVLCSAVGTAQAQASDNPTVWLELGGQLTDFDNSQEIFAPRFPNSPPRPSMFSSSDGYQGFPSKNIDETGKLTFEPKGTDWAFSASVRYGRSKGRKDVHQQSYPKSFVTAVFFSGYDHTYSFPAHAAKFADTAVGSSETHVVLDFQAGKDIGLGLFGTSKDASSVISVGVRFAQFTTKSNIALKSDPDWHRLYKYLSYPSAGVTHQKWAGAQPYHSNAANLTASRSFHGIGPSLSWNASAPIFDNIKAGELTFDWGVNAAILFGRQKARTHHQTTGRYSTGNSNRADRPITYQAPTTPDHSRSRAAIVPNIGGFAGGTFRIENFKVSAGYRADFFFNAMDDGIDNRSIKTVGFYGPFATISIGMGG